MIRKIVDGDIVTNGQQFLEGKAATGQGAANRLKMFLGESFVDVRKGTPWFQSILGKASQNQAEVSLKQRILTAPDVAGIRNFKYTPDLANRAIAVTATIVDDDGQSTSVFVDEVLI